MPVMYSLIVVIRSDVMMPLPMPSHSLVLIELIRVLMPALTTVRSSSCVRSAIQFSQAHPSTPVG